MANAKLICALLLCMVVTAPMLNTEASIPCHTVKVDLNPCLSYFTKGGKAPPACCRGVQNVYNAARTTKDRRDTCSCLKTAAKQYRIVNFKFAANLPRICKVKIPYPINASIDCSRFAFFTTSILSSLSSGLSEVTARAANSRFPLERVSPMLLLSSTYLKF
ncbi:hypothetical protein POTOM_053091 [Populus tomentosa]|uniref:Bifunctional inhibitor/plant lipid transfer protein/seed storage helical domain-containing protein n=1 Tax=Populus tomentosa TaxID=118781 RepID=A0A8X7Y4R0_POPTO|nr:hypothetical protein POTOM_053091 [Populus tomentosa]